MNKQIQKVLEAIWFFALFAFLYTWFSRIHPLVVYDADDWTYIGYIRTALPEWGTWNPAKVFPEVFMSLLSSAAIHFLMPFVGDYFTTLTVAHAFVVSTFITVYLLCFSCLIKRAFHLSRLNTALLTALFFSLHFLVFRNQKEYNSYLFQSVDLNCFYNYLLPSLLNASLVMLLFSNPRMDAFLAAGEPAMRGLFCVAIYFAIFSNLPASGILAAYAGSRILLDFLRNWKDLKSCLKRNRFYWGILAAWFISAIYEINGGRASVAGHDHILFHIKQTVLYLFQALRECNGIFWLTVAVIGLLTIFYLVRFKGMGDPAKCFLSCAEIILVAGAALAVYMILLCAVVNPISILRSENLFGLFFYLMLLTLLALGYVAKQNPRSMLVMPLLLVFLVSSINTTGKTFAESNVSQFEPEVCTEISRDILNQVIAADKQGLTEMTLFVPVHTADLETDDNWPHSLFLMERISKPLYEHGIISSRIKITAVADPSFNERYNLPLPQTE